MSTMQPNPFLSLTPAQIDVLDDMVDAWRDKDRHGELETEFNYGPKKLEAFYALADMSYDAWAARVAYRNVEEEEA